MPTITGHAGVVRWGYYEAATLGAWTIVTRTAEDWTLTARVQSADTFRCSQQPLVFCVPRPSGDWRMAVTSLQIDGTALTATVQPSKE